ncbi:hypothetical protein FHX74_002557 [Friedmanniella endophytica]|uniref:AAA domain-containing protein n=1 Tax=Microlunatus kandeliicorticis TaxID=1759536 RepID=A0A7W3ITH4_9ACTN|nr:AAA family ATPase [Microlunatus kandeliicorticis]MBA8794929.1 hypothetical protein [Microlunatus kandeliicorticis]
MTDDQDNTELRRPWQPVDLEAVLSGTYQRPEPTVGSRTDGRGLFYPGKSHTVVSETEGGKTWFALSAALDEMAASHHAVYIDFEDDEGSVVTRLLTLGATPDRIRNHFHYLRPDAGIGADDNAGDLTQLLGDTRPRLVVLDGITEAMGLHGLDPLKNADAAIFGRRVTKRITDTGAAVVSLDHVTKDRENRGRYALGAVHKLNGLSGAQYTLTNRTPFGIGLTGRSTINIAKDRPGQLRAHALPSSSGLHWYGDLVLESHNQDFAEVSITPPHQTDEDFRPTELMHRISEALAEYGPLAQRRILAATKGKTDSKRQALDFLILDGYVTERSPHELIKPYPRNGQAA